MCRVSALSFSDAPRLQRCDKKPEPLMETRDRWIRIEQIYSAGLEGRIVAMGSCSLQSLEQLTWKRRGDWKASGLSARPRRIHWPTAHTPQPHTTKKSIFNYTLVIITNPIIYYNTLLYFRYPGNCTIVGLDVPLKGPFPLFRESEWTMGNKGGGGRGYLGVTLLKSIDSLIISLRALFLKLVWDFRVFAH